MRRRSWWERLWGDWRARVRVWWARKMCALGYHDTVVLQAGPDEFDGIFSPVRCVWCGWEQRFPKPSWEDLLRPEADGLMGEEREKSEKTTD